MTTQIEMQFELLRKLYIRELKGSIYVLPLLSLIVIWLFWPLRSNIGAISLILFVSFSLLGLSFWQYRKLNSKAHLKQHLESDLAYLSRFESLIEQRKKSWVHLNLSLIFLIIFAMNTLQRLDVDQTPLNLLDEEGLNILAATLVFSGLLALINFVSNDYRFSEIADSIAKLKVVLNNTKT